VLRWLDAFPPLVNVPLHPGQKEVSGDEEDGQQHDYCNGDDPGDTGMWAKTVHVILL